MKVEIQVHDLDAQTSTRTSFTHMPIRIGRDAENDLVLSDAFVSSWHGAVRDENGVPYYFDLGSTNGSNHLGRRLGTGDGIPVQPYTEIEIGRIRLRLHWIPEPQQSPAEAQNPASESAPPRTAIVDLQRVHGMLGRLRPLAQTLEQAKQAFEETQARELAKLPPGEQVIAQAFLRREFGNSAADPAKTHQTSEPGATPHHPTNASHGTISPAVAEAFAEGLFSLLRGQEQFAHDMSVRASSETTPLHAASRPQALLEYLCSSSATEAQRVGALEVAFNDLKIFNIAQLNAFRAGARALLQSISPGRMEREVPSGWGSRSKALWEHYVRSYEGVSEDERALVSILFGPHFVRAFALYWEQLQAASERGPDES